MSPSKIAFIITIYLFVAAGAAQAQTAGVVTLRANSTSATGSLVPVLTWSTNPTASSCRASSGWSGNKSAAGTETLARITASTNYTLTCTWGTGSARVSWVPPTANTDGSALTNLAGFRVYYSTSNTSFTQSSTVNDMAASTTTISSLAPATWYFKVRALNSSQVESADSNIASKAVTGATSASTVGITITSSPPPPPPPPPPTGGSEVEPNNYTGQAQLIGTAGTTVNGTMSGSGDADYYRVSLPAGRRLTATMTPNSNSDYELYLFNSGGTAIAWSENGRGVSETVTVTNSGTSAVTYCVSTTTVAALARPTARTASA
jgi:serine protease